MCQEQQYLAIDPPPERKLMNISQELPADLVLKCMSDSRLPCDVRASFTRLMLHLHVVRGSPLSAIRHARLWSDIPNEVKVKSYKTMSVEGYSDGTRVRVGAEISPDNLCYHFETHCIISYSFFLQVLLTVERYLNSLREECRGGPVLKMEGNSVNNNKLTYEMVTLAKSLAQFGYYTFDNLLKLAQNLLAIVDDSPPSTQTARTVSQGMNMIHRVTQSMIGGRSRTSGESPKVVEKINIEDNARVKESRQLLVKTKLTVAEILQANLCFVFVMDVRRDYRITMALSWFKQNFPCDHNGTLCHTASGYLPKISKTNINEKVARELYDAIYQSSSHELHLDGGDGQLLLAILLQMTMSDYPPLTSIALKVLFRHFTQYQELLEDLKQVDDVHNYRQVDRDLFILKNLTEKSELWVHGDRHHSVEAKESDKDDNTPKLDFEDHCLVTSKGFESDDSLKAVIGVIDEHYPSSKNDCLRLLNQLLINEDRSVAAAALQELSDRTPLIAYPLIRQILVRIKKLCYKQDRPDVMNQQLLKNMRVYEVVLEFLSIPYDKVIKLFHFLLLDCTCIQKTSYSKNDTEMPRLITLSHEFLRSFCKGNKENQSRLHSKIRSYRKIIKFLFGCVFFSLTSYEKMFSHQFSTNSFMLQVKLAYFQFLLHCYIDTDAEMKDAYKPEYVDALLHNMLTDVQKLNKVTPSSNCSLLEHYICHTVTEILLKFFEKPYSEQAKVDIHILSAKISNIVAQCFFFLKVLNFTGENNISLPASITLPPHSSTPTVKQRWQCAANSARFIGQQTLNMRNRANSLMMPGISGITRTTDSSANVVTCYHKIFKTFIFRLIQHCKTLMHNKQDNLCTRVLQTLCRMCNSTKYNFSEQRIKILGRNLKVGQQLRSKLLNRYFGLHGHSHLERQQSKIGEAIEGIKGTKKGSKKFKYYLKN
uniref:Integrator complex subunit 1 n=1 Tax=Heterorhabditis bacteriophora TaxID=37862 RepID=A0A1I7WUG1_HETBA